jgi:hypothetical protein
VTRDTTRGSESDVHVHGAMWYMDGVLAGVKTYRHYLHPTDRLLIYIVYSMSGVYCYPTYLYPTYIRTNTTNKTGADVATSCNKHQETRSASRASLTTNPL